MCIDPFYHETQISGDMTRQEWNLPKKKYLLDGATLNIPLGYDGTNCVLGPSTRRMVGEAIKGKKGGRWRMTGIVKGSGLNNTKPLLSAAKKVRVVAS